MTTQPHILVIDDEPQILRALRTILTAKHFRVTVAARGRRVWRWPQPLRLMW